MEKSGYEKNNRNVIAKRAKSRHAAQSRRLNENNEFDQLSTSLPIARAISCQLLDKASIVRLAISCMRLYIFSTTGYPQWNYVDDRQQIIVTEIMWHFQAYILDVGQIKALDGFLICIADNNDILYVSETVCIYLGLSQVDMIGNCFYDYLHKNDCERCEQAFRLVSVGNSDTQIQVCIRMKSNLTKRASKEVLKCSMGFKVIHLQISVRENHQTKETIGVCCLGIPLPNNNFTSIQLDESRFSITTNLDFSIHYIDPRGEELLNCSKNIKTSMKSVKGTSLYQLISGEDVQIVAQMHQDVLRIGAVSSPCFRILRRESGSLLVEAIAIRIHRQKARENYNYITCCITVISKEMNEILDVGQVVD